MPTICLRTSEPRAISLLPSSSIRAARRSNGFTPSSTEVPVSFDPQRYVEGAFVARSVLALFALVFAFVAATAASAFAADDPAVTLIVHVPLDAPRTPASGREWYCETPRTYVPVPIPATLFADFEEQFRALGPTVDRFGFGSWMVGQSKESDLAFLAYDHVFISTHLVAARGFVPGYLRALRTALHQREALAEISGSWPDLGEARLRLDVALPFAQADYGTLRRLHLIFGDGGRSGASQYADENGVHIYSSVQLAAVERIERELSEGGFPFSTSRSTFIVDDAPACPRAARAP